MPMENIIIKYIREPVELKDPILIEGLPGVGNVGKLAADHLIDELNVVKFADIYSVFFPPQVLVNDGIINLVNNALYYKKAEGNDQHDLIVLVGDYQGLSPEGQYKLVDRVLDVAEKYGVKKIVTLGGYGLGKMVESPRVLGAATDENLIEDMKDKGVVFPSGEPGSGIVGASGLLLGLGKIRGMAGVCLMGETSGYFADPKSAQAVLMVLINMLNVEIDFSELENKAIQIDKITSQLKAMEKMQTAEPSSDDLGYIG